MNLADDPRLATTFVIHQGDAISVLRSMPEASVHCVATSPPYWGLRNYSIEPTIWGGVETCLHEWGAQERGKRNDLLPSEESTVDRIGSNDRQDGTNDGGRFCSSCSAWRGCLGLEPTPQLFVEHLVLIFRELRRVLRPEGTLWLNLGDCYVTNPIGSSSTFDPKYASGRDRSEGFRCNRTNNPAALGLKSKDLVMIPARVAIALQADGWYLRSQIPWIKRNGMPDSTPDRPSSMVEYIFQFSKSEAYYYDRDAVRLPQAEHERTRRLREQREGLDTRYTLRRDDESHGQVAPGRDGVAKGVRARHELAVDGTRVRRNSDWFLDSWRGMLIDQDGDPLAMIVNPQPFGVELCRACKGICGAGAFRQLTKDQSTEKRICHCGSQSWLSHFATFSEKLVEPIISAATSEHGACGNCGAPYERVVEAGHYGDWHPNGSRGHNQAEPNVSAHMATSMARRTKNGDPVNSISKQAWGGAYIPPVTIGWRPTCSHPLFPAEIAPCTVLDPFSGSARTGLAAMRLGRNYIGIEMNSDYILMANWLADKRRSALESEEVPA